MKKIVVVIGARPQFIKHFPLELALQSFFEVVTLHTGQHYDEKMSQIFFDELRMGAPAYQLQLRGRSHGIQTAEMLGKIEEALLKEKPQALLVYGDTNSTVAGALAAVKLMIPVIHVEAGLRSFNKSMPEEINRILTDHMSSLLFCSSEMGVQNLKKEGIEKNVCVCGDLMKDALFILKDKLVKLEEGEYVYTTLHRPYNTDNPERLMEVIGALNDMGLPVIFPVHPRTASMLSSLDFSQKNYSNIKFIQPVGYIDSLRYQLYASCVITDSGGMQKEAYWLGKKCITIRSETEWIETLEGGWNTLLFGNLNELKNVFVKKPDLKIYDHSLYGDGKAASKIAELIDQYINN